VGLPNKLGQSHRSKFFCQRCCLSIGCLLSLDVTLRRSRLMDYTFFCRCRRSWKRGLTGRVMPSVEDGRNRIGSGLRLSLSWIRWSWDNVRSIFWWANVRTGYVKMVIDTEFWDLLEACGASSPSIRLGCQLSQYFTVRTKLLLHVRVNLREKVVKKRTNQNRWSWISANYCQCYTLLPRVLFIRDDLQNYKVYLRDKP
jgi:hypothetical protein